MEIQIVKIEMDRLAYQNRHQGITAFFDLAGRKRSKPEMIQFLLNGNLAYVLAENSKAYCQIRYINGNPGYVATVANGVETDNLLSLPKEQDLKRYF